MLTRKIGKIIRGNATPAQLVLAAVLGAMLGFMPGFAQAAGLIVLLVLALVILNANLALAAITGLVAKPLALAALPVSFAVGRALLDGPTQPLLRSMINAPVLALFGFEYYATTGGAVLGLAFGLIVGFAVVRLVRSFRRKMASLEEGSDRYRKWANKGWVKAVLWVFFAGGPKGGYAAAMERRGKVIRPIGVVAAALVIALLVIANMFFTEPIVTAALKNGLERANGATVDVRSADLDLKEGRMTVRELAMADPNALDHDLLRAATVEVDISGTDLLRKRLTLDRVVLNDAQHGVRRAVPGRIVGRPPRPAAAAEPQEGEKTIEDYIAEAEKWKQRLSQVRRWLEKLSGPEGEAEPEMTREPLKDRLLREAMEKGYANVAAGHLIEGRPKLTVTELIAEKVRSAALADETVDIHGRNLSTHPHLLAEAPSVTIRSSGDTLDVDLLLAGVSSAGGDSTVRFAYRGLPADTVGRQLAMGGQPPLAGGTIDVAMDGTVQTAGGTWIEMPLQVTLNGTTITIPGAGSQPVEKLSVPLGLRGPIDGPAIMLDDRKLADALVQAGAGALAAQVRGEADRAVERATQEATQKLQEELGQRVGEEAGKEVEDTARGLLDGLLGGQRNQQQEREQEK